ncbi:MAG TPA: resolvase [Planctomycetes bacterium]|nr:resolvase [Planctomycetota bacterium]|tara:strand:- start:488 stop:1099 length:612 start_codon:yes stop_codon:yes gene_type:complete
MRAAIYARVSTYDQSPLMQLEALREYAARRGFAVAGEFVDHGISGTKSTRPQLNLLMEAVRKRQVDAVLVFRFDRMARSTSHLLRVLEEFDALGVQFVSYAESIDTSTPMGRAMYTILGALAELERNLIVERSVEGQKRARARGKHVGRPRVQVSPERVLELSAQGHSQRAISATLGISRKVVRRVLGEAAQAGPKAPQDSAA